MFHKPATGLTDEQIIAGTRVEDIFGILRYINQKSEADIADNDEYQKQQEQQRKLKAK